MKEVRYTATPTPTPGPRFTQAHLGTVFVAAGIGLTTFAANVTDGWVLQAIKAGGLASSAMGLFLLGRETV